MTNLSLRDDLVQRLRTIARRENRPIDEVVETLLDRYEPESTNQPTQADALRQDMLRIYDRARRYWQTTNDPRQHLGNEELDQQFWLIDPDGVPHLKAEQSSLTLPTDPLEQMLDMAEADLTVQWHPEMNQAESNKVLLNTAYTDHLLARTNRPADNNG